MNKKVAVADKSNNKKTKLRFVFFTVLLVAVISVSIGLAALGVELKYREIEKKADLSEPAYRIGALYYNHLTYREQQLYDAISKAASEYAQRSEILPYSYDSVSFKRAVEFLLADCPELFFLDYNGLMLLSERHASCVELKYRAEESDIIRMESELTAAVDRACEQAKLEDVTEEFDYELRLHDYLINFCKLSADDEDCLASTAYGALVNGKADALGYAGAIKLLLDAKDIYSFLVFGEADGGDHVWNIVYIDDKFYHLDAAWNDPNLDFAEGMPSHGYFNLTAEAISADHKMRDPELMPEATDTTDYYVKRGLYVHNLIEFERVTYLEVLSAGFIGSEFIELYPSFSPEGDDFRKQLIDVIKRVNAVQDDFIFKEIYRTYNAVEGGNAMTIQLYYDKQFTPSEPETNSGEDIEEP